MHDVSSQSKALPLRHFLLFQVRSYIITHIMPSICSMLCWSYYLTVSSNKFYLLWFSIETNTGGKTRVRINGLISQNNYLYHTMFPYLLLKISSSDEISNIMVLMLIHGYYLKNINIYIFWITGRFVFRIASFRDNIEVFAVKDPFNVSKYMGRFKMTLYL